MGRGEQGGDNSSAVLAGRRNQQQSQIPRCLEASKSGVALEDRSGWGSYMTCASPSLFCARLNVSREDRS